MVGRVPRPLVIEHGKEDRGVGVIHAQFFEERKGLAAHRPLDPLPAAVGRFAGISFHHFRPCPRHQFGRGGGGVDLRHRPVQLGRVGRLVLGGDEALGLRFTPCVQTRLALRLKVQGVVNAVDSFEVSVPILHGPAPFCNGSEARVLSPNPMVVAYVSLSVSFFQIWFSEGPT